MNTKDVSFDRIINAIRRKGASFMFVNLNGGVSVTKNLKMFDVTPAIRRIGVYTSDCPEKWIDDDLTYMGFLAS